MLAEEGFAPLLIETVGVGQSEVSIARVADTVVLLLHPGWGDEIQAAKAGLLEIADVFFVNKADQGNADAVVSHIKAMLALSTSSWKPPVLSGSALTGEGLTDLVDAILTHRQWETQLSLGRSQTRNFDPRRAARHVVETDAPTECDRGRIAAVLTTNPTTSESLVRLPSSVAKRTSFRPRRDPEFGKGSSTTPRPPETTEKATSASSRDKPNVIW